MSEELQILLNNFKYILILSFVYAYLLIKLHKAFFSDFFQKLTQFTLTLH